MRRIIVDTNVFVRFFLNDIPEQKKQVEELLRQAQKGEIKILVPQAVIFELHYILQKYYHLDKEKIIHTINSLVSTPYLEMENKDMLLTTLNLYMYANISLIDCLLIVQTKAEEAELFTFDKQLQKLQNNI